MFYKKKTHVSRLEDSQYWVNKNGLGGAAYTMIQNHKGGFDSASGMSKSAKEQPMGAKNGKILSRPGQKIRKKMKNSCF